MVNKENKEKKPITLFETRTSCCGCSSCFAVCPASAISMQTDDEGFPYPVINSDKCIHCGQCVKVCAFKADQKARFFSEKASETECAQSVNYYKRKKRSVPYTYAVKHLNMDIRMESRSGGVFTALSDFILGKGGVIYGCALTEDFSAAHIRAEDADTRDLMRGSKYIQSDMGDIFIRIKDDLQNGREVLFSGTSCQVAGLSAFLGKDYENLFLVDIVCYGVPSPAVWHRYLRWQEKKSKSLVIGAEFRNKYSFGWKSHLESLYMINGKQVNSQIFKSLFYGHWILRPACFHCPYKDVIHPGNITIADYWGIDRIEPSFNDDKGVSLVMINDEKGLDFFDTVHHDLEIIETDVEKSLQPSLIAPFPEPDDREMFWNDYRKKSFETIAKKYAGYGDFNRYKSYIKRAGRYVINRLNDFWNDISKKAR